MIYEGTIKLVDNMGDELMETKYKSRYDRKIIIKRWYSIYGKERMAKYSIQIDPIVEEIGYKPAKKVDSRHATKKDERKYYRPPVHLRP